MAADDEGDYLKVTVKSKQQILKNLGESMSEDLPQIAFVVSNTISAPDYIEIQNRIMTENLLRGRPDFIFNPRLDPNSAPTKVTVSNLEELEAAQVTNDNPFVIQISHDVIGEMRKKIIISAALRGIETSDF